MSANDRVFHLRNGCSRVTCVSTSADLARFLPNFLSGAVVRSKTEMTEHPLRSFRRCAFETFVLKRRPTSDALELERLP